MKRIILVILLLCNGAFGQPTELPNFPVGWTSGSDDENFNSADVQDSGPVVSDLTGDGQPEVIVTGRKDIWVFNAGHTSEATALFHWTPQPGYEFCSPVAVARLTSDGEPWVVAGGSRLQYFDGTEGHECPILGQPNHHPPGHCYHWQSVLHGWKIHNGLAEEHVSGVIGNMRLTTPAVGDVDGDGLDELAFVGSVFYGPVGGGYVNGCVCGAFYEYDEGSSAWVQGMTGDVAGECPTLYGVAYQIAQGVPAIGDLDEDGVADVVYRALHSTFAFSFAAGFSEGSRLWSRHVESWYPPNTVELGYWSPPPMMDGWDFHGNDRARTPGPVLADLNSDGHLEVYVIVWPSTGGAVMHQLDRLTGQTGPTYTFTTLPNGHTEMPPASEFLAADDRAVGEVRLFGTYEVYWIDGGGEYFQLRTSRWRENLEVLPGPFPYDLDYEWWPPSPFNTDDAHTPALLSSEDGAGRAVYIPARQAVLREKVDEYSYAEWTVAGAGSAGREVKSNVTAADIDQDGLMELVTTNRTTADGSELHALETNVAYNPESVEWSGYRNGPKYTGLYAQPVTGVQPLPVAKWSGRVIVHDYYLVNEGQTLTIEPGTVVEFRPGAAMYVYGTLYAAGHEGDSIYFKPDGTSPWTAIDLMGAEPVRLEKCVIHGGNALCVRWNRCCCPFLPHL